jgi:translation initiation factor IF-2
LGQAEIIAEFEIKKQRVAGCRVGQGRITKRDTLHLKRGGEVVGDCQVKSLKMGKEGVNQAKEGEEFGAVLSPSIDFEIGDMLVSYRPKSEDKNG